MRASERARIPRFHASLTLQTRAATNSSSLWLATRRAECALWRPGQDNFRLCAPLSDPTATIPRLRYISVLRLLLPIAANKLSDVVKIIYCTYQSEIQYELLAHACAFASISDQLEPRATFLARLIGPDPSQVRDSIKQESPLCLLRWPTRLCGRRQNVISTGGSR